MAACSSASSSSVTGQAKAPARAWTTSRCATASCFRGQGGGEGNIGRYNHSADSFREITACPPPPELGATGSNPVGRAIYFLFVRRIRGGIVVGRPPASGHQRGAKVARILPTTPRPGSAAVLLHPRARSSLQAEGRGTGG